jgi:hypothetical protein
MTDPFDPVPPFDDNDELDAAALRQDTRRICCRRRRCQ